jgi:hypothetical protein
MTDNRETGPLLALSALLAASLDATLEVRQQSEAATRRQASRLCGGL